jgi:hypothetical protein
MPTSLSTYIAVNYLTDSTYADGTVLTPGGTRELTACTSDNDHIVGVKCASTSGGSGAWDSGTIVLGATGTNKQTVATVGRVNVQVVGPVKKGDWLGPAGFSEPVYEYTGITQQLKGSLSAPSSKLESADKAVKYWRELIDIYNRTGKLENYELPFGTPDEIKKWLLENYNRSLEARIGYLPADWVQALGGVYNVSNFKGASFPRGKSYTLEVNLSNLYSIINKTAKVKIYGINTSGCAKTVRSKNEAFAIALESTAQYTDSTAYLSPTTILCSLL